MKWLPIWGVAWSVLTLSAVAGPAVGQKPPTVVLQGAAGGRTDGTAWSSDEIKGKVFALFYVDPDEKDLNEPAAEAIQAKSFPGDRFGSVAVINQGATWTPNWLIDKLLASKQKKFPRTIYVRDVKKALVTQWKLADDSYDILVFDRDGVLRFCGEGALSAAQVKTLVSTIEECLK